MPTDDVNASLPDVPEETSTEEVTEETQQEPLEITDDDIKSHPLYQDLEKKHSAARKGLDDKAKEVKKLKHLIVDDTPEEKEEVVEQSTAFTVEEKELLKWEIKNQDKIDLCQEDYDEYVTQGVSPKLSLRLALQDKGITDSNISDHLRQISSGQPDVSVNREAASDITEEERKDMEMWGYSEETLKRQKQLKKERITQGA